MRLSRTLALGLLLVILSGACDKHANRGGSHAPPEPHAVPSPPDVPRPSAARYQPAHWVSLDDGARGVISNGKRIVLAKTETRVIESSERLDHGVAIPARLGGGYLFNGSRGTFFSQRFDGELIQLSDTYGFTVGYKSVLLLTAPRVMKELPSGREIPLVLPLGQSGDRALLALQSGTMLETLDHGRSWHAVESPPGGVGHEVSCAEAGCTLDGFYRVGWGFE